MTAPILVRRKPISFRLESEKEGSAPLPWAVGAAGDQESCFPGLCRSGAGKLGGGRCCCLQSRDEPRRPCWCWRVGDPPDAVLRVTSLPHGRSAETRPEPAVGQVGLRQPQGAQWQVTGCTCYHSAVAHGSDFGVSRGRAGGCSRGIRAQEQQARGSSCGGQGRGSPGKERGRQGGGMRQQGRSADLGPGPLGLCLKLWASAGTGAQATENIAGFICDPGTHVLRTPLLRVSDSGELM